MAIAAASFLHGCNSSPDFVHTVDEASVKGLREYVAAPHELIAAHTTSPDTVMVAIKSDRRLFITQWSRRATGCWR